jgi:mannitol-1-phosphate 5-dehydrogenase
VTKNGSRTYVGFGFGAIQAGLFLYEAQRSGAFGRLVVGEVLPEVVATMRQAGGRFGLNIAQSDRLEQAEVGPIEILDVAVAADRARLAEAVAAAEEIGTAVPGVGYYASDGPGSLHRILAEGLRLKAAQGGPRAVVYAAENHNHAAEILEEHVLGALAKGDAASVRRQVRFLNTVVGKMSGAVAGAEEIREQHLVPMTPGSPRAFLVEAFNRILVSRIVFDEPAGAPPFQRGFSIFEEKADLLPFEEAKLYGHNATHALAAYLGAELGVPRIADLADVPGLLPFLRAAFVEESGAALIRKYRGLDPLFTPDGYIRYAEDLLVRMTNPFLRDTVERVGRHPQRKLAWPDRLIGTIRLALSQSMAPRRYALGVAAALAVLDRAAIEDESRARLVLDRLWNESAPAGPEKENVLAAVSAGVRQLRAWRAAGLPRLDQFIV